MGDMLSNYALSNFFPHPYLKEIYNIGHLKLKKKKKLTIYLNYILK